MKKFANGEYIEMTDEEVLALETEQASMLAPIPTQEDRLAALESAMLAMMGGGAGV